MNFPVMPGTLLPQQQQQQQSEQQAIIEALRGTQQTAPAQQGRVVSANADLGGLNTDAFGRALGGSLEGVGNNLRAAGTYGTNPFSQQTNMLAMQDAAFK